MKYFTPELLCRYRSDVEDVAVAAADEWELAQEAYVKFCEEDCCPEQLIILQEKYYLHDAQLISLTMTEGSSLYLLLQVDAPPTDVVLMIYGQVENMSKIDHSDILGDSPVAYWLYDETECLNRNGLYEHRILFSDAQELRITFREFSFDKVRLLYDRFLVVEE